MSARSEGGEEDSAALHGVALLVGEVGLLVLGASGAGKSSLAARMIADWPFGPPSAPIRLVADDRVLVRRVPGGLVARPHPLAAGRLELRGHGLMPARAEERTLLRAVMRLDPDEAPRLPPKAFSRRALLGEPLLEARLPPGPAAYGRLVTIWPYLRDSLTPVERNPPPRLECSGALRQDDPRPTQGLPLSQERAT